ncbi:MAG TPA: SDR family oxidoreductase [Flavisolibacter sp.]|nr:SDR family oxidoreductase [Flavisolibacter sp.]
MQTILITGANGFIGNYLIEQLSAEYLVIATGKGVCRFSFQHENLFYRSMDFTDPEKVKIIFDEFSPHFVIHCGAMSKPDDCELNKELAYLVNVQGTKILLERSKDYGSFFIQLSTDFIFKGDKGMYMEEDLPAPVNYYGETKLQAEKLVKAYPFDWTIVRTVLVYGNPRNGRQNILSGSFKTLLEGKELRIFDDQVRNPTYVEDVVIAIYNIIKKRVTGIMHISGSDILTPYQMVVAMANYLDLDATLVKRITAPDLVQPAQRPLKTGFDISKAKAILDYQPTSFAEGLKKTFLKSSIMKDELPGPS